MTKETIRRHLRKLRAECIDDCDDLVVKRVAYEMECAIRRVTERTRGWPDLPTMARQAAQLIRNELKRQGDHP